MHQITTTTKAEAAYAELRARILDGSLAPGASLEQSTIAQDYGISTTPVREALRRLESEQLVVVKAHHGPRVAELSTSELHDLFAVRLELDPLAASLAATEATAAQMVQIRTIIEKRMDTPAERVAANRQFHRSIYQACANPVLAQVLDSLWNRCDRYRFLLLGSGDGLNVDEAEHHAMVDAMESRNAKEMRRLVRSHVASSYAKLEKLAEEFTSGQPGGKARDGMSVARGRVG
jgi:DNA-binding GntR family transcriptional regulator